MQRFGMLLYSVKVAFTADTFQARHSVRIIAIDRLFHKSFSAKVISKSRGICNDVRTRKYEYKRERRVKRGPAVNEGEPPNWATIERTELAAEEDEFCAQHLVSEDVDPVAMAAGEQPLIDDEAELKDSRDMLETIPGVQMVIRRWKSEKAVHEKGESACKENPHANLASTFPRIASNCPWSNLIQQATIVAGNTSRISEPRIAYFGGQQAANMKALGKLVSGPYALGVKLDHGKIIITDRLVS
jgi:hypothetical protein